MSGLVPGFGKLLAVSKHSAGRNPEADCVSATPVSSPGGKWPQEECPSRGNSLHHRHYRCHGLGSATADRNDQSASGPAVGHDAAVSRALRTVVIARCGHAQGPATRRSSQRCHGEVGRRRSEGSAFQPVPTLRLPAPVRLRSLGQTSGRSGRGFRARRHGLAECPLAVSRKVPAEIPFQFSSNSRNVLTTDEEGGGPGGKGPVREQSDRALRRVRRNQPRASSDARSA
jgi:hypothetical protein